MQNQEINWQAHEFRHYEKDTGWYVTMLSISLLIVGFFILQGDYFAAASIVILAGLVVFFSRQTPENIDITLDQNGVHVDTAFYPYKQILHFWIVNTEHHQTLNLETRTLLNRAVIIELGQQDPAQVKNFLLAHKVAEHHETEPSVIQKITHRLKF